MRFSISFMGETLFEVEFAWPARGVFPVPDWIPSELDREFDPFNEED